MSDLKDRTRDFALRIVRLSASLPSTRVGDVVGKQLLRCGTSVGAHFRESLRARSKAEYTAKLNGGLMELEETLYWLEIVEGASLIPHAKLKPLRHEADELIAIFASLIKKWKGR